MPNLEWAFNPKFMWFEPGAFCAIYSTTVLAHLQHQQQSTQSVLIFFPLFYFVIWQVDWISCFSLSPCRCNHVLSAPKAYQPSGRQRCWASQEQGDGGRGGPSGHGLCCQHPAAGKTNSAFSQCVKENVKLWWNLIIKWPPVSTIWSKEVSTPWEAAVSRKRDELSPPKHCFSLVKPEMW